MTTRIFAVACFLNAPLLTYMAVTDAAAGRVTTAGISAAMAVLSFGAFILNGAIALIETK